MKYLNVLFSFAGLFDWGKDTFYLCEQKIPNKKNAKKKNLSCYVDFTHIQLLVLIMARYNLIYQYFRSISMAEIVTYAVLDW